jgi:hypothetical protein
MVGHTLCLDFFPAQVSSGGDGLRVPHAFRMALCM